MEPPSPSANLRMILTPRNSLRGLDVATLDATTFQKRIQASRRAEGDKHQRRKVYDCFVLETAWKGSTYVLFGGEWFQVDKSFHAAIEKDFNKLVAAKPFCPSTKARNERDFIVELDKRKDLLNLDQVKIDPHGAKGAMIEPCDFFSQKKHFIHLKDGHSSAPISHLWNQATVSAESFVRDEKFRIDLRKAAIKRQARKPKKVGFENLLPDGRVKPRSGRLHCSVRHHAQPKQKVTHAQPSLFQQS